MLIQIEKNNPDIKTHLINKSEGNNLELDIRILLYRSICELITNCVKHANCTSITITLWSYNHRCFAEVMDNGIGFEYKKIDLKDMTDSGFGLFSIKERIDYSYGEMKIETALGQGTKITLTLPQTIS